jgi:serine protease Do
MKKIQRMRKHFLILLIVGVLLGISLHGATASKDATVQMFPADFSALAEGARPGVVNIRTVRTIEGGGPVFKHFFGGPFGNENPFEHFGPGSKGPQRKFKQQSLGSGFILDREGHVVTNNHVVANADKIKVKLANGKEFDAQVVGRDPNTDLALIKIKGSNGLTPLPLGDSEALRVGSWVLAIGSPFGLEQTVTTGIVSAKGRVIGAGPYDDFIQTDASINPGNSGGPLLNMKGEVIGINTAIFSRGGGNVGVGFAIPVNMANGIIAQLKEDGEVTRGWLGVGIQNLTPELAEYYGLEDDKGALVTQVFDGDPAEKAGIRKGDVITAVEGKRVTSSRELSQEIAASKVGEKVSVALLREGRERTVEVELTKRQESRLSLRDPAGGSGDENGDLGLKLSELTPDTARRLGLEANEKGVVVTGVDPDGKGANAGIAPGDLIKEINREPTRSLKDYRMQMAEVDPGEKVKILIKRPNAGLVVVNVTV